MKAMISSTATASQSGTYGRNQCTAFRTYDTTRCRLLCRTGEAGTEPSPVAADAPSAMGMRYTPSSLE